MKEIQDKIGKIMDEIHPLIKRCHDLKAFDSEGALRHAIEKLLTASLRLGFHKMEKEHPKLIRRLL